MKKYHVMVKKYGYSTIRANSENEAKKKTENMWDGEFDWSERNFGDAEIIEECDEETENIVEVTWRVSEHYAEKRLSCITYAELKDLIISIAEKFELSHRETDWCEVDYCEEISKFTDLALATELWNKLRDVPVNSKTECIEEPWNHFHAGTHREIIWHWLENTFHISVGENLM